MSEQEHWSENAQQRKVLYMGAKTHGYKTKEAVLEFLGDLAQYQNVGAALTALMEAKKVTQAAGTAPPVQAAPEPAPAKDEPLDTEEILKMLEAGPDSLAEAPASVNTFVATPEGYNVQVTLRDTSERALLVRFVAMTGAFGKLGYKPVDRNGNYRISPEAVAQAAASVPAGPPPPPEAPSSSTISPTGGNGTETFLVEKIQAQLTPNGNRKYATIGGKYRKYGVTAWPEVAEEELDIITGYNPANLDAGQEWDVSGFSIIALCEHPADKEYPTKVLSFAKQ